LARLEEKFKDGDVVNFESLKANKSIRSNTLPVKVLANGKISKKLTLQVNAISATAKEAIQKAGGTVEIVK